jgi:predicted nucleotidyltransferase
MLRQEITIDHAKVAELCREFGVARLSVFGSALREDFDPSRSDIDLLVEFLPERVPGLFAYMDLEDQLSEAFGRKVDLSTSASLSKYFREEVVASAELMYVAS